jgi:hypothetical protein
MTQQVLFGETSEVKPKRKYRRRRARRTKVQMEHDTQAEKVAMLVRTVKDAELTLSNAKADLKKELARLI